MPVLWTLIKKYGGDPEVNTIEKLSQKFVYTDFPHFIDTWIWKNQFLREYADFEYFAEAVAKDLVSQNIVYAEMFISPSDFHSQGLDIQRLIESIRLGFTKVPDITINMVVDLIRDFGPKSGMETVESIKELKELGIVGITIGGSEQLFPPEPFSAVYEKARDSGFRTSAHAGEVAGPESIWGAIKSLRVDRIGHGTTIMSDPSLLDYVTNHRIPIETCPISNLRTGAVPSISDHPVREIYNRGIPISINTDDPKMFGNSLLDEYELLSNQFGFTREEINHVQQMSIESSWADEPTKIRLLDLIADE